SKAPGFGQTTLPVTDMLILEPEGAEATVYGASLAALVPEPVGQSCLICPREACAHRTGQYEMA
ncbi:MAG: short-chain fatty acyl-CoA regulator family protein, partial [Pseudomonadota bacterium]